MDYTGRKYMTANELAEKIQYDVEPYLETDQFIFDECANMLRQQADRINVLEANHQIQLNINDKALKYIKELEEQVEFLKDKNIMVDNSAAEYKFQCLYGEDMLEANKRITNLIRKMVDDEFEKKAIEK